MKIYNLLLILLGLAFSTEILFRAFISSPSIQQFDPELGYTNIPGSRLIESQEGYGFIQYNSIGFNDEELQEDTEKRIFVIGDSYTEALQVNSGENYVSILQRPLKDQVDFIKLARDSFLPAHYPVVSARYYGRFKPELTIVQLGSHTLTDLMTDAALFEYDQKGNIVSASVPVSSSDAAKEKLRLVINNSALAYYLMRRYKPLLMSWKDRFQDLLSSGETAPKEIKPNEPDYAARLSFILDNIHGRKMIVYMPAPHLLNGGRAANNRIMTVIKEVAENKDIPFLDLTEPFIEDYKQNGQFLNGFMNTTPGVGHLNRRGHQIAAEKIQLKLRQLGYIN